MATFTASIGTASPKALTIALAGRVDTTNAGDLESSLDALRTQSPEGRLTLDVEGLEYISSAGLRVMMRLLKREGSLSVINASTEIYNVFDMTGLTELMDVRRAMRRLSVEGCELLGSGANGDVYRLAKDEMVKVFRPTLSLDDIEEERKASRQVFVLGIPCAIPFDTVRCGDCYGTVYEALDAKTIVECIREDTTTLEHYAIESARMLAHLHETEVPEGALLPADRWLHAQFDSLAAHFSDEEVATMHGLLHAIPPMNRFVHNDYHPKNVMDSHGELMLIDLGEAGTGNPLIDVIHTYFVFNKIGTGIRDFKDDDMSFIGITYGELRAYWAAFLPTYCGDEQRCARLNELLEPWGQLLYLTSAMGSPRLPDQYRTLYADRVRQEVLTRADEMRAGIGELSELCGIA